MSHYFTCQACGSAGIQYLVWFDQRTGAPNDDEVSDQHYYCAECDEQVEVYTEEVEDEAPEKNVLCAYAEGVWGRPGCGECLDCLRLRVSVLERQKSKLEQTVEEERAAREATAILRRNDPPSSAFFNDMIDLCERHKIRSVDGGLMRQGSDGRWTISDWTLEDKEPSR